MFFIICCCLVNIILSKRFSLKIILQTKSLKFVIYLFFNTQKTFDLKTDYFKKPHKFVYRISFTTPNNLHFSLRIIYHSSLYDTPSFARCLCGPETLPLRYARKTFRRATLSPSLSRSNFTISVNMLSTHKLYV